MSGKQRVVMDTSSLIGAVLLPRSVPRQAFLAAVKHDVLCVSAATLNELRGVVQRAKFDRYMPPQARLAFVELLIGQSLLWEVDAASERAASGACRDAKDDKFLALALGCKARVLVSSDADLLVMRSWRGVPIMTPAAFVALTAP